MEIFVDSGAWLALADKRDGLHQAATDAYPHVLQDWNRLITTNLVITESYNLIRRRLGFNPAIRFLSNLRRTARLRIIYSNASLERSAEAILQRYRDQDFSLVDAVSFAVMQERNLQEAFAFDHHFTIAGFILVPAFQN